MPLSHSPKGAPSHPIAGWVRAVLATALMGGACAPAEVYEEARFIPADGEACKPGATLVVTFTDQSDPTDEFVEEADLTPADPATAPEDVVFTEGSGVRESHTYDVTCAVTHPEGNPGCAIDTEADCPAEVTMQGGVAQTFGVGLVPTAPEAVEGMNAAIAMTVKDNEGNPLGGMEVTVTGEVENEPFEKTVTVDEDGFVDITGLPSEAVLSVTTSDPDGQFGKATMENVVLAPNTALSVEVVMQKIGPWFTNKLPDLMEGKTNGMPFIPYADYDQRIKATPDQIQFVPEDPSVVSFNVEDNTYTGLKAGKTAVHYFCNGVEQVDPQTGETRPFVVTILPATF